MQINPVLGVALIAVVPDHGESRPEASVASLSTAVGPTEGGRAPAVRLLNPQATIDPALGIVVTEYFNQAGKLTAQYPSARAVDSYRIYGLHDQETASSPVHD